MVLPKKTAGRGLAPLAAVLSLCVLSWPLSPTALSASEAGEAGEEPPVAIVNIHEVLMPRVRAGLSEALSEEFGGASSRIYARSSFFPEGGVGVLMDRALLTLVFALNGNALTLMRIGGGDRVMRDARFALFADSVAVPTPVIMAASALGSGAFLVKGTYVTPAGMRFRDHCLQSRSSGVVCRVEPGALYALPLRFSVLPPSGPGVWGRCLLFFRHDSDGPAADGAGGFLRWEVDRCVPEEGFLDWRGPYGQDEEGALRTADGWAGVLDGVLGRREVVARGEVALDGVALDGVALDGGPAADDPWP